MLSRPLSNYFFLSQGNPGPPGPPGIPGSVGLQVTPTLQTGSRDLFTVKLSGTINHFALHIITDVEVDAGKKPTHAGFTEL